MHHDITRGGGEGSLCAADDKLTTGIHVQVGTLQVGLLVVVGEHIERQMPMNIQILQGRAIRQVHAAVFSVIIRTICLPGVEVQLAIRIARDLAGEGAVAVVGRANGELGCVGKLDGSGGVGGGELDDSQLGAVYGDGPGGDVNLLNDRGLAAIGHAQLPGKGDGAIAVKAVAAAGDAHATHGNSLGDIHALVGSGAIKDSCFICTIHHACAIHGESSRAPGVVIRITRPDVGIRIFRQHEVETIFGRTDGGEQIGGFFLATASQGKGLHGGLLHRHRYAARAHVGKVPAQQQVFARLGGHAACQQDGEGIPLHCAGDVQRRGIPLLGGKCTAQQLDEAAVERQPAQRALLAGQHRKCVVLVEGVGTRHVQHTHARFRTNGDVAHNLCICMGKSQRATLHRHIIHLHRGIGECLRVGADFFDRADKGCVERTAIGGINRFVRTHGESFLVEAQHTVLARGSDGRNRQILVEQKLTACIRIITADSHQPCTQSIGVGSGDSAVFMSHATGE